MTARPEQESETPLCNSLDMNPLDSNDIRAWRSLARRLESALTARERPKRCKRDGGVCGTGGYCDACPMVVLNDVLEYFEEREDVIDGSYGEPHPNEEMSLAQRIRALTPSTGGS